MDNSEDKKRLEELYEEHKAVSRQIGESIDLGQITVLTRKKDRIEEEIHKLETKIQNHVKTISSITIKLDIPNERDRLKNMLIEFFVGQSIENFCHSNFIEFYPAKFPKEKPLDEQVLALVKHCESFREMDKLKDLIQKENPALYDEYKDKLYTQIDDTNPESKLETKDQELKNPDQKQTNPEEQEPKDHKQNQKLEIPKPTFFQKRKIQLLFGSIVLLLLIGTPLVWWMHKSQKEAELQKIQKEKEYNESLQKEPEDYLILISKFDKAELAESEKRHLDIELLSAIQAEFQNNNTIKVKTIETNIQNPEDAIRIGKEQRAKAVIYGTYYRPVDSDQTKVQANFEFIEYTITRKAPEFSKLSSVGYTFQMEDIRSLKVEEVVSTNYTYILNLVLGIIHFKNEKWQESEEYLNKAYKVYNDHKEKGKLPAQDLLYYYLAIIYMGKNEFDKSEEYLNKAEGISNKSIELKKLQQAHRIIYSPLHMKR